MIVLKKLTTVIGLLCLIASSSAFSADHDHNHEHEMVGSTSVYGTEHSQKSFVNLSSDEMNRAAMALLLSTNVLTKKK